MICGIFKTIYCVKRYILNIIKSQLDIGLSNVKKWCNVSKVKNIGKYCILLVGIFIICQPIISVDVRKYLSSWQWPSRKDTANFLMSRYGLLLAGSFVTGIIAAALWDKRKSKVPNIPIPSTKKEVLLSGIMVPPRTLEIDKDITFIGKQKSTIFPHQQGLFICLDDQEVGKGAQTLHTLAALYHKVPLLVSTSLLKNIFVEIDTQQVTVEKALQDNTGELTFLLYVATIRTSFDDKEWLILKKVGGDLVLLLPMHVVQKLGGSQKYEGKSYTQQELNLGLKISNFEKLNSNELLNFLTKYTSPQQLDYFLDGITSLLITQDEYKKNNVLSQQPQWTFFLNGHGLVKGNIAGLSEKHFIEFLNYLNTQLLTRFLVVNSCYAMSVIKRNSSTRSAYSFPIVVIGAVDCVAYVPHPILHVEGLNKESRWEFAENLAQSFEYIWQNKYDKNPYDIALILASQAIILQKYVVNKDLKESLAAYIPYVLPAHGNTVVPLFPTVEINEEMTRLRDANNSLDVLATIEQQQKQRQHTSQLEYVLLLLNAESGAQLNIQFPLILRKSNREQPAPYIMVSSLGQNYFYMANMDSEWPLMDIIRGMGNFDYGTRKIYWIANFVDRSGIKWPDIILARKSDNGAAMTYQNIIIDHDSEGTAHQGKGGVYVYVPRFIDIQGTLNYGRYLYKKGFSNVHQMDKKRFSEPTVLCLNLPSVHSN